MADPDAIKGINKNMAALIKEDMVGMKDAGTGGGLEASEELGNLPIRNWGQGSWKEGAVKTTGMSLVAATTALYFSHIEQLSTNTG